MIFLLSPDRRESFFIVLTRVWECGTIILCRTKYTNSRLDCAFSPSAGGETIRMIFILRDGSVQVMIVQQTEISERRSNLKLLIIRHGESEGDILKVCEGRADFPLTDTGHAQAEALSRYISDNYTIDKIYHSTLKRAVQTAQHLAEATDAALIPEPLLMEFNNGLRAGLPYEEAYEKYPQADVPLHEALYGQESMIEFRGRAERVLSMLISDNPPKSTVAVVTHGGMIGQLYKAFLRLPVDGEYNFSSGDTAIHEWEVSGGSRNVIKSNFLVTEQPPHENEGAAAQKSLQERIFDDGAELVGDIGLHIYNDTDSTDKVEDMQNVYEEENTQTEKYIHEVKNMAIDPEIFIHESDRAALKALKAIPGFTQILKGFMKIWNEKQFRILNMSTYLNVNDNQMSEYYDMLKPICLKLGIKVPELYIALDPRPNAYTSGDTDPFIVVTSGLLNAFPKELLPVVLAHECGHIVCHHVLYKTMGKMILNGAAEMIGLSSLLTAPIQTAFYYWMRCSEFSADRVAAVCCGDNDIVTEMCMRLAGYDKNIPFAANKDSFMRQAVEYKKMIDGSAFNKTMEFLMFNRMSHPLNAVRAYECKKWSNTDSFKYAVEYVNEESMDVTPHTHIPMPKSAKDYCFKDYKETEALLKEMGFCNIVLERKTESSLGSKAGQVLSLVINNNSEFNMGTWFRFDDRVVIYYYLPATYEEMSAQHPGEAMVGASSLSYMGRNYNDVINELRAAGFTNFETSQQPDLKMGILSREGDIARIAIDHLDKFNKGDWFRKDALVSIRYHVFEDKK